MRSKVIAPVAWSLVLGVLMLGLAACGSKENEPKGPAATNQPQAAQPAAPVAEAPGGAASAPATAAQDKLNVVEFFTKADAEEVLGKPVNEPSVQDTGGGSANVTYITSDFSGIGLFVRPHTTAQTFDEAQAKSKSVSGVDPVTIAGLGEKAYWVGKSNQLNVLKNSHWLIITIPLGDEKSLDMAKKAAEKILPRVP